MERISLTQEGHSVRTWELQRKNRTEPMPPLHSFFQSLADPELRQWVSQLPQGSGITMEFALGGGTGIGRPLKPSQAAFWKELHEFTEFCQGKKVDVGMFGSLF